MYKSQPLQLAVKPNVQTSIRPLPKATFNPVDDNEEFITTNELSRGRMIEKISKNYPAYHRIVLRRSEASLTSSIDANTQQFTFINVSIGERISNSPAILSVESFAIQDKTTTGLNKEIIEIGLRGMPQFRSFDSATKTTTELIGLVSGTYYWNANTTTSMGLPITNLNQLQNQPLTITLKKSGSAWSVDNQNTADWVLVLNVISLDEDSPV